MRTRESRAKGAIALPVDMALPRSLLRSVTQVIASSLPLFLHRAALGHRGAHFPTSRKGEAGERQRKDGSLKALGGGTAGVEVAALLAAVAVFAPQGELDPVDEAPRPERLGEIGAQLGAVDAVGEVADDEDDHKGGGEGVGGEDVGEERGVAVLATVEDQEPPV